MIHASDNTVVQYQLDLNQQRRRDFIAECNAALQKARETLVAESRRGHGLSSCMRYTAAVDRLLQQIYDWLINEAKLDPSDYVRIAVIAQGGYGRNELTLYSDIDLLFLMPDAPRPVEQ